MTLTGGLRPTLELAGPPAAATTPRPAATWWAAAAGAAAALVLLVLARDVLPDDSWIMLDYARNLAEHGHWGLLEDRPSNTATSPLNVALLAGGIFATGRPVLAVGLVLVVSLALVGWWSAQLARALAVSDVAPYLLLGLLVSSPLLVSTVGMETYLGAAVLIGVARYAVAARPVATGVLCGLAVLTRPDLVVPAGVLALGLLTAHRRPRRVGQVAHPVAAAAVLVVLPWHLFAWVELGGAVPDTLAVKTHRLEITAVARGVLTSLAVDYIPTPATILTLATLAVGAACALGWLLAAFWSRRWPGPAPVAVVFAVAGVAHLWALDLLGATAHAWYYGPALACAMTATALTATASRLVLAVAVAAVAASIAVTFSAAGPAPWRTVPLQGNTATAEHYATVGQGLAAALPPGTEVESNGEVGALAYFCRCALVDHLSDRALVVPYLDAQVAGAGPLGAAVWRANYSHREPPGPAPQPGFFLQTATVGVPLPPGVASWTTGGPVPRTTTLYRR